MHSILTRIHRIDERPEAADEVLPALATVFRHWIQGRARPDVVLVDPDGGSSVHLDHVLVSLCASPTPLGRACALRLGLPEDATIADAAHQLLFARHHPDGPRCRSFRSASYYLYGLAQIEMPDEPERPSRVQSLPPPTELATWSAANGQQPAPAPPPDDRSELREGAGQ